MPYIPKEDRSAPRVRPGDLNFTITWHVNEYIKTAGLNYKTLNEAIGALECAKLELYRRIAAPYEDTKIKQNGDVYSPEIITP